MVRRIVAWAAYAIVAALAVVALYLAATLAGAAIKAPAEQVAVGEERSIFLLTTLLHADFVVPVDDQTREAFAFLRGTGVPIDHLDLEFLVFGWGSRAFYTQTPSLADIRPGPMLRAVTGDSSVMHVFGLRTVESIVDKVEVRLSEEGHARLLAFLAASFERQGEAPLVLSEPGFNGGRFFAALGGFDIIRPCNIWVARGLRQAGVSTGIWTPTTWSLLAGMRWHGDGHLASR